MRKILFLFLVLAASVWRPLQVDAQNAGKGYAPTYHLLHSGNLIIDKNFYLVTVINHTPGVKNLLNTNQVLKGIFEHRIAQTSILP
jgi:hypothetical protein